jgi:hypothetical protein
MKSEEPTTYLRKRLEHPEFITGLIGIVVGIYFVGIRNVNPLNSGWLLQNSDLGLAHQIWVFFRNSPILQWPLVGIPEYGVGWNTVYTPMSFGASFGLPLKYFSFLLPSDFQFLGLYMVLLFGLQAFWGCKLIGIFVRQPLLRFVGGCSFLFFPIFLYRMTTLVHPPLAAHWMILAAFYLYFKNHVVNRYWAILLLLALAENIYIFVMLALVCFAASTQFLLNKSANFLEVVFGAIKVGFLLFAGFTLFGYLAYSENAKGTGFFRLNLASFFFSRFSVSGEAGDYSRVISKILSLQKRDFIAFEGEGFGYLGLFVLLLTPFSLVTLKGNGFFLRLKNHVVLISVCFASYLFALSNSVAVGRRELNFPTFQILDEFRKVFRSAPRFSWLFYYLMALIVVASALKILGQFRTGWIFALFLLTAQIYDQFPAMRQSHQIITNSYRVENPLRENFWTQKASLVNVIRLVPSFDLISDTSSDLSSDWVKDSRWVLLIDYAATNNLTINFAYSGRPSTVYVEKENAFLTDMFSTGDIEDKTLYFFDSFERLKSAINSSPKSTRFFIRDGFFVLYLE